jgi:hypothetical protein
VRRARGAAPLAALLLGGLGFAVALGGCVEPRPTNAAVALAPRTPPPPMSEERPSRPAEGYAWIPGRWSWQSRRFTWESGHWALAPAGSSRWVPGAWEQRDGGWIWRNGRWE